MNASQPLVMVIFGATGDLAATKLLPGLRHMATRGLLPDEFRVVGAARKDLDTDQFRDRVAEHVDDRDFLSRLSYVGTEPDLAALAAHVDRLVADLGHETRTVLYLAVPPVAMPSLLMGIGQFGLNRPSTRVVIEKPFGFDLVSAQELDRQIESVFTEPNVYRIDHFLGKEDVQNILTVRFGNRLFETFWCADHVSQIEIDVPEEKGVGERAGFYDKVGAYRDMVVTHLFQVLGFVAMEAPRSFTGPDLAAARFAVFDALRPIQPTDVVRGVFDGYRDLPGVAQDSDTETFVALRTWIDNDRWRGVPVVLRTGKRLAEGRRVVSLRLRKPETGVFGDAPVGRLAFEIGDPGGLRVCMAVKQPGPDTTLQPASMNLDYGLETDADDRVGGYERLLHDVIHGDHTLFTTARGIEQLWSVSEPLLTDPPMALPYAQGSWGPAQAAELAPHGWYLPYPG